MNKIIILLLLIIVTLATGEETYTSRFDYINVDDILNSERLLENYVSCLKNVGKCSPDAQELKRILREALKTNCAKCSERQRENSKKVISHLINKRPEIWADMKNIYDPTGEWTKKFDDNPDNIEI